MVDVEVDACCLHSCPWEHWADAIPFRGARSLNLEVAALGQGLINYLDPTPAAPMHQPWQPDGVTCSARDTILRPGLKTILKVRPAFSRKMSDKLRPSESGLENKQEGASWKLIGS